MEEEEIDLRGYLKVLKKRWKLVVQITIGCAVISTVISLFLPKVYQTSAIIESAKIMKTPIETAATTELLFKNPNPYLKKIAREMSLAKKKEYELARNFKIVDNLNYLSVSAKGNSPEEAKKLSDLLCSMILKRHADLMDDALKISEDEINNIKEQLSSLTKEVEEADKKLLQKENVSTSGQGYVFQGLIQSKENALKRQGELDERLRERNMELKYYTKSAVLIAEASLPVQPTAPKMTKIVFLSTFIGLMLSIIFVFIIEYFGKNP